MKNENIFKIELSDAVDIEKIAESGQCFRWEKLNEDEYRFFSAGSAAIVSLSDDKKSLNLCCEPEMQEYWKEYFDLSTNYGEIIKTVGKDDEYLENAASFGLGIRILRQDPWEMIVSFVISQRKSIPAIRTSLFRLTDIAGKVRKDASGNLYHDFPSPKALAELTFEQLSSCGVGYRAKYLHEIAVDFASGAMSTEKLASLSDEELHNALLSLFGVGDKVASCVELFGFHRLNAFPKDVWINKVLSEHYADGFDYDRFYPYNGLMQQYLFYYRRLSE